ncbi:hypothetical protein FO519_006914 [Halicephalobus sp. NKZ332]|nr:hypothetical protein FO519_006914 [Halicephalobus sp. NKZ332]
MVRWFLILVLFAVVQISSSNVCDQYFVRGYNGKSYTIKVYKEYLSPDKLTLIVKKPGRIFEEFPLSTCDREYVAIGKYAINSQRNYLFFHIGESIGEGQLVIVDLMALSGNISNGDCISTDMVYFGKHKVYIYRIVDDYNLKRWKIREAYFDSDRIKINYEKDDSTSSTDYYYDDAPRCNVYDDAPKCDVPEGDTSCEEYQALEGISMKTLFEHNLRVVVIVVGALFFILILLCISYYLWNWKSKSVRRLFGYPNEDGNNYTSIPHDIVDTDG